MVKLSIPVDPVTEVYPFRKYQKMNFLSYRTRQRGPEAMDMPNETGTEEENSKNIPKTRMSRERICTKISVFEVQA